MKALLLFLLPFSFILKVQAQGEKIKGIYYNTEETSRIKIYKAVNGKYYGKLVWVETTGKKDINNPDPGKRDQPLIGLVFCRGFIIYSFYLSLEYIVLSL